MSYEVPKDKLPKGISYRKVYGPQKEEDKPKKTVNILKIIPKIG